MNKGNETLSNPMSSEKEKVRGDASNAKSISPKNTNSTLKLKGHQIKINPLFPQRLVKKEEDTKFQNFLLIFNLIHQRPTS